MIFPISASYYKAEIFDERYHGKGYKEIAKKYYVNAQTLSENIRYGGRWNQEFKEFTAIMDRYYQANGRNIKNPQKWGEYNLTERTGLVNNQKSTLSHLS